MSSEGDAAERCKQIFCAISAILVKNDELSASQGRAISKALSSKTTES